MKQFLSRLDYAGISILVWGSSLPPIFYCFACKETFYVRNIYVAMISVSSLCCFLACMLPGANTPRWRPFRAYIFIALGISAAFPFVYITYIPSEYSSFIIDSWNIDPYMKGGAIYIGGAICYAMKFPEKWFPCKFDLIGQSHNVHHMTSMIATGIMFYEGMSLYQRRKQFICPIELPPIN